MGSCTDVACFLSWAGGMPEYVESLHKSLDNNYQGWNVVKA
jgi:hypothetical protein